MINRLTNVPIIMAPIIAMANGFCSSDPMSELNNIGMRAKMDVSEVITMDRRRFSPA